MRTAFLASLFTAFLAVATMCALPSSGAQTAPAAAKTVPGVHAGKEVFTKNCMQCHSVVEGVVTFGPSLYGEMKPPHPRKTNAEIRLIIKNGKNGANGRVMPAFGERLSAEEVDSLLAYIHTL